MSGFARSSGAPIEWNGLKVHISFEQPLDRPVNVWIRDIRADPAAGPQSITVSLRKRGRKRLGVVYEGVGARSWRFWADDPLRQNPGPILCVPPRGGTELLVYNGWLMGSGSQRLGSGMLAS